MSRSQAAPGRQRRAAPPAASAGATPVARRISSSTVIWLGVLAALLWSYWPVAVRLFKDWQGDPNYSVGQLVPLAALYLLWQHRAEFARWRLTPCWWGLAVILIAQIARFYGLRDLYESAERYSLVLTAIGLVLLIAGKVITWRLRWILLFLFLMVPFPGRIHNEISNPLQTYATSGTVFILEVFGVTVSQEGNVLLLNGTTQVAVAEACSGLRMLTAFVIVSYVLAYIVKRPPWQKAGLVLSSVPIAIVCNLGRLMVTAILFMMTSSETAETFFHDFAGVSMMPLAVLLLVGVLWLFNKLVIPDEEGSPQRTQRVRRREAARASRD